MYNGVGQFHSKYSTGVFKASIGNNIASLSSFGNHLCAQVVKTNSTKLTCLQMICEELINCSLNSGCRNIGLKATAFATIAITACWIHRSMPQLTGNSMVAMK